MLLKKQPAPPPRTERRNDGTLYAVAGFSRSGKSTWVASKLASAKRVLVWDYPKGEWAKKFRCRRVTSWDELKAFVLPGSAPARIAFFPPPSLNPEHRVLYDFHTWSRFAWIYVRAHGAPLVVEELATVTNPSKAPEAWGNICRMGLGYGSDIYAITQRPAESDKTSLGNAGVVHCGIMGTPRDRQTMAEYLDVSIDDVRLLKQFEWIERDRRNFKLTRGKTKK